MRSELWKEFENRPQNMKIVDEDFAPNRNYERDAYNGIHILWNPRTVNGMDNSPRMKEMFVELENMIENNFGAERRAKKEVRAYKGTTKKWQVLDDAVYDKDQIEKLQ